jgi:hypothetical protein
MAIDLTALASEIQGGNQYHNPDGSLKSTLDIGTLLTQPQPVPNPAPVAKVPKRLDVGTFLSLLSSASKKNLTGSPYAQTIADYVTAQDRAGLGLWIQLAVVSGWITAEEAAALQAALAATEDDPGWTPTVAGPSRLEQVCGVGSVNHDDINKALGRKPAGQP